MELKLTRETFSEKSTIGKLYVDGVFYCYTLEDTCRQVIGEPVSAWKQQSRTAIPVGKYTIVVNMSNRFKKELPLLIDVEGFSGVRIHPGNSDADTEGCILVGRTKGVDFIGNSQSIFGELFKLIQTTYIQEKSITLRVEGLKP